MRHFCQRLGHLSVLVRASLDPHPRSNSISGVLKHTVSCRVGLMSAQGRGHTEEILGSGECSLWQPAQATHTVVCEHPHGGP